MPLTGFMTGLKNTDLALVLVQVKMVQLKPSYIK